MKKSKLITTRLFIRFLLILIISVFVTACEKSTSEVKTETPKEEAPMFNDILWSVNAIHPDGQTLAIKAVDKDGNLFDVKAIQNSNQTSFLNINAFVGEKQLPVKMLLIDNTYAPVKAIDRGGITYDIKAITKDGEKLDVKGITRFGNIISLKAINKEGDFYGVKAMSPSGELNDVKGIKINIKEKEMTLNGFSVYAHIKAMHQSLVVLKEKPVDKSKKKKKKKKKKEEAKKVIKWNVKAITLDGENLDVKAIDTLGNKYDIKAIQDSEQYSFLNVKAFVNGNELPVKIMVSEEEYAPVIAIARDGTKYELKAFKPDGSSIAIKGVNREGSIIHIKAVTENGDFYGVKAFSPKGKLDDIKGIKIFERDKELTIRGNEVYAHVKAITQ